MHCDNNQITKLDNLPNSLEELCCGAYNHELTNEIKMKYPNIKLS